MTITCANKHVFIFVHAKNVYIMRLFRTCISCNKKDWIKSINRLRIIEL